MQINFYMGDQDRTLFHDYIFSHEGYMTPEKWESSKIPIANSGHPIEIDFYALKIFKEDIFSKDHFINEDWITYLNPFKKFHVHGPGMQYRKSFTDRKGIHRGRIYMGLLGTFSFVKPNQRDPEAFVKYNEKHKQMENFYRSCCRYIRKNYRKDSVGFYHGTESDLMENRGIEKHQF